MHKLYGDQIQFIIIYTIEAHPVGAACPYTGEEWTESASTDKAGNPLTQPATFQERVTQVTQMVQELGITVRVLIDEMDNPVWCTYGPAPNIAYLIGKDGKIIEKQGWYKPNLMEVAIKNYLESDGESASSTTPKEQPKTDKRRNTETDGRSEFEPCESEPIFTVSPLDIDKISSIVPLGNLNPPSHTFPTDHIYFHITRQQGADRPHIATLYSPGNLTITRVSASEHVNAGFTDYTIFLKPCEDVSVMFYHVSSLSEDIFGDVSSSAGWVLNSEYTTGGETYRMWGKELHIAVKTGDILGTTGGNPGQWALDLGVYDRRYRTEMIANPERWADYRYKYAVCPLDYYEKGPLLDQLVALVERDSVEGEKLPCGSVLQDIPGTAQGCWFLSETTETYPEDPHLTLVRSNIRPSLAVLSVGNSVVNLRSARYEFSPETSGLLNRDFQDIKPDGRNYGFQVNGFQGIIIIRMADAETLWLEALVEATTNPESWVFTDNKTVFVR